MGLIMEGAMQDLWCLNANDATASNLLTSYMAERDSMNADQVALPRTATGKLQKYKLREAFWDGDRKVAG